MSGEEKMCPVNRGDEEIGEWLMPRILGGGERMGIVRRGR